ncbi:MAG: hypothetical protein COV43_03340 [Deltaproteobacteria bacterium CG11_big_fil_rev_8_21_14_0_20_42_23]|nr:MAG: hypothetical protein COV43_03340 [Deltaproteobacteria bacterium CG11_big_fil_rev_8_21_14_0_20_42_23]PJC63810.1 MAG: hypothetical protein CO021_07955 [Deltaproteobacteria bacterium CG_4_9_14_0_2_um_filter_42_21]
MKELLEKFMGMRMKHKAMAIVPIALGGAILAFVLGALIAPALTMVFMFGFLFALVALVRKAMVCPHCKQPFRLSFRTNYFSFPGDNCPNCGKEF